MPNDKKKNPVPQQVSIKQEVKETVKKPVVNEPEYANAKVDGVIEMLNVRSTPEKKEGNIVTQIKNGTQLQVVDPKKAAGEWYKIVITNKEKKTDGYVMKKYIKII